MAAERLFTRDLYNNPTELGAVMLNFMSEKLLNGKAIEDPNTPFLLNLEMGATLACGIMEGMTNEFSAIYPRRAQDFEDLYKSISDYEFFEMFASPAATKMSLMLEKNQIMMRAPIVGDYHLAILPRDTVIEFGDYKFGLYYPIKIMIAASTKLVYITYDNEFPNPLHVLGDINTSFREYKYSLADIVEIELPIYQFEITKEIADCSKVSGFNKRFNYKNRFYAARVYSFSTTSETWEELNISYSETNYDPSSPTVVLKVYSDTSTVEAYVPQIYFDLDLIGTKLKIELYTTLGAIDIDISNLDVSRVKLSIPSQSDNPQKIYADPFNKLETCHVIPLTSIIAGGTNEPSFEVVKRRIQNRVSTSSLLASPGQLKNYFEDLGFSISRVKDTFEERIYAACGLLTDSQGIPIQVAMDTTEVPLVVESHMEKHVVMDTNAITVLPTAIFRYDTSVKRFIMVSTQELQMMDDLYNTDKSSFCLFLNNNAFSRPMYHVHLKTDGRTPFITNYDLSSPAIDKIRFIRENINTSERLIVVGGVLTHNGYEDVDIEPHKFQLDLSTSGSAGIAELLKNDPSNVKLVMIVTVNTTELIQVAEYNRTTGLFTFSWTPNYKFNYYNELGVNVVNQNPATSTGDFTNKYSSEVYLPLSFTAKVVVLANLPDVQDTTLYPNLAGLFDVKYKQVGYQELDITLGTNLHDKLYSSVDVTYRKGTVTDPNFLYTEDEYLTYDADGFERNTDNSLKIVITSTNIGETVIKKPTITVVSSSLSPEFEISPFEVIEGNETNGIDIVKKYSKGDPVLVNGERVLLHKAGEIKRDLAGNPLIHPREMVFMGQILHVGLNLFYSELSLTEVIQNITKRTMTQYDKLEASKKRLLENTYVLYRPYTCMGNGAFYTDSKKIVTHPLDISLRFKCYVPEFVLNDTSIQRQIRTKIVAIAEDALLSGTLSVTHVAGSIKDQFTSVIRHIDIFGINNNVGLQMIENMDKTKQPILKQELWLDENGYFTLNKSVIVQFVN